MQLQEILELLKVTPIHYNVAMTVVFILAVIFFIAIFKYDTGQDDKKTYCIISIDDRLSYYRSRSFNLYSISEQNCY